MDPLLILGAGSFATETLDIAEAAGTFDPAGFVTSLEIPSPDATHCDLPVYGHQALPFGPDAGWLVAGIVSTRRRAFVADLEARGYRFATVRHPAATVSRRARIEPGCVIHAGVVVSANTVIGPHVIVNRGALIGHDVRLEPFVTVGPGAVIAGAVTVGAGTYLGAGAVIRDHLDIGAGAVVAAGAVVVRPVDARTLVAGVPARATSRDVEPM